MKETTLQAMSDGFGGIAITDLIKTDVEIITMLINESTWEVIDGLDTYPEGEYLATISYYLEDNWPESGASCVIDSVKFTPHMEDE